MRDENVNNISGAIAAKLAPSWLGRDDVRRILTILNDASALGDTPYAMIVGGAVRNEILAHPVKDIDIATSHSPEAVQELCAAAGVKTVPTGLQHGTVTAVIDKTNFEITTLRHDLETDGRHATVAFTDDWREDAARRDFTMNALYMDMDGHVYDPLGGGYADAKAGRLRFVGAPATRIAEDALRILRFFRFWAIYARQDIDQDGVQACAAARDSVFNLSKERITSEILKILMAPRAAEALAVMAQNSIWPMKGAVGYDAVSFNGLVMAQEKYRLYNAMSRFFNVFCGDGVDHAAMFFALSNRQHKFLRDLEAITKQVAASTLNKTSCRRLLYQYDRGVVEQFLFLNMSGLGEGSEVLLRECENWARPIFPVTGHMIMAAGVPKGPEMGRTLKALEQKWIESDFSLSADELLKQL